jgi:hypothetical protein
MVKSHYKRETQLKLSNTPDLHAGGDIYISELELEPKDNKLAANNVVCQSARLHRGAGKAYL